MAAFGWHHKHNRRSEHYHAKDSKRYSPHSSFFRIPISCKLQNEAQRRFERPHVKTLFWSCIQNTQTGGDFGVFSEALCLCFQRLKNARPLKSNQWARMQTDSTKTTPARELLFNTPYAIENTHTLADDPFVVGTPFLG